MGTRLNFMRDYAKNENRSTSPAITVLKLAVVGGATGEGTIQINRGTRIPVSDRLGFLIACSIELPFSGKEALVLAIADHPSAMDNDGQTGLKRTFRSDELGLTPGISIEVIQWYPCIGGNNISRPSYDATRFYYEVDGLSSSQIDQMVRRFAPVLNFHERETFFPVGHIGLIKPEYTKLHSNINLDRDTTRDCDITTFSDNEDELGEETFVTNCGWTDDSRENPDREVSVALYPLRSSDPVNSPDYGIHVVGEFKLLYEALYQNVRARIDYLYELIKPGSNLDQLPVIANSDKWKKKANGPDGLFDHIRFDPMFSKDPGEPWPGRPGLWRFTSEHGNYVDLYCLLLLCEGDPPQPKGRYVATRYPSYLTQWAFGWLEYFGFITKTQWEIVKNYGVIAYYLIYPFNDYCYHGGINVHEFDFEGCAGVFVSRDEIDRYKNGGVSLDDMVADWVVTTCHKEGDGFDEAAWWKDLCKNRSDRVRDPDNKTFDVFIAVGSHGTYLTPGKKDFAPWIEIIELLRGPLVSIAAAILCGLLPFWCPFIVSELVFIGAMLEKVDKMFEDNCSDKGLAAGTEIPEGPKQTGLTVDEVYHGGDSNIYKCDAGTHFLGIRTFPGVLGCKICGEQEMAEMVWEIYLELHTGDACIEESADSFSGRINRFINVLAKKL